jgi:hypothetical protein
MVLAASQEAQDHFFASAPSGTVHPVLSRLFISLEKNGGLRCLESQSVNLCKNLTGNY